MGKFEFNSSRYARLFESKDNRRYIRSLLQTEGLLKTNFKWYMTQSRKAESAVPVDPKSGVATFSVRAKPLSLAPLMDMRAPLADSHQESTEGGEEYTGSIPHFIARGFTETALEREAKVARYEMFGDDAEIVAHWVQNVVQRQIDSADATLNYLTAQLMSKGWMDYTGIGMGIQGKINRNCVPAENFVKAGVKVWSDPDCDILGQMRLIEKAYRDKRGYEGALKWMVTKNMYQNVMLANAKVRELVNSYRQLCGNVFYAANDAPVGVQMFEKALADYGEVSPIHVVAERANNSNTVYDLKPNLVQGWDDVVAVLCPADSPVEIQWCENLDRMLHEKYGSSVVSKVFAETNNGLGTLVNTTLNNGNFKEWHTDLMMSAVPTLVHFTEHLIVDTSKAL